MKVPQFIDSFASLAEVPEGAWLFAGGEKRTWRKAEAMLIDDSYLHEVWHNGTTPRTIFYVSFLQPALLSDVPPEL